MEKGYELTDEDGLVISQNLELMLSSQRGGMKFAPERAGLSATFYRGLEGEFPCEPVTFNYDTASGKYSYFGTNTKPEVPEGFLKIAVSLNSHTRKGIVGIYLSKPATERAKKVMLETAKRFNASDQLIKEGSIRIKPLEFGDFRIKTARVSGFAGVA